MQQRNKRVSIFKELVSFPSFPSLPSFPSFPRFSQLNTVESEKCVRSKLFFLCLFMDGPPLNVSVGDNKDTDKAAN